MTALEQLRHDLLRSALEDFQAGEIDQQEWERICKLWLGREPETPQPKIVIGWKESN